MFKKQAREAPIHKPLFSKSNLKTSTKVRGRDTNQKVQKTIRAPTFYRAEAFKTAVAVACVESNMTKSKKIYQVSEISFTIDCEVVNMPTI